METITTTSIRENISRYIDKVKHKGISIGVKRRGKIDALIIKYPENLNNKVSAITNFNANSSSFDFLNDEPNLYDKNDLKEKYA
ncbi:MAG: hypothetical protein COV02_02480 [Candidatus Terrybacteria bacterium CG10_big_fil_rev_8_21_14_0_10_41_10]|uniref:Antitoxin n=1 Tax=Candidatus Terrybacteria bacterium CG10_big_fil_rev_8_21_14_0_10_41_10 TaxID=1975026 RepID=A0A2M8LA36_9BACT|nr:MAG: hypothetical protein COV02_02480 [Candidatus Terrybacteria bacterium CG10_big_fil_rev_8_21_14_0_10_41_10]